jgi:hypothetical protein
MIRQGLLRRLDRVERTLAPQKENRMVLRFEGPGTEHFPKPSVEGIDERDILTVVFVEARDGRRAEPS